MTMMDALVKRYPERGLWLEQVEKPRPGRNEVLVKIHKTAICGTDVHIYEWNEWAKRTIKTPMTIGHEFVGHIEATGEDVSHFKEGDLVSGEGHVVCGRCRNCFAGRRHLCRDTQGIGVNRTGVFAEYAVIPAENTWLCKGDIPENLISIFDPLGNATHMALSFDMVGEDVLITGAGPIGIMAVAIAKHVGARNIVITDINDYRLALAAKMGAGRTVNVSRENLKDVMREIGMKEGFDVGLEMSGNKLAFADMIDNMIHGGKIAILGLLPSDTAINWDKVIFNGLWIKGIYGREMFETWYKMSSMLQSGLDVSSVITHEFYYRDFQKGFDAMSSGKSGKVILNWV